MPEYDETAGPADEQSSVATAATDESTEAASEPVYDPASADEADEPTGGDQPAAESAVGAGERAGRGAGGGLRPLAELRQKLRYAPGDWYVVHSYAGYENKVKTNLETRISSLDMEDYIFQVEVPTREEVEVKNGKRLQVQNKVFPGYILVRMELTPGVVLLRAHTPGVTGFVGATGQRRSASTRR